MTAPVVRLWRFCTARSRGKERLGGGSLRVLEYLCVPTFLPPYLILPMHLPSHLIPIWSHLALSVSHYASVTCCFRPPAAVANWGLTAFIPISSSSSISFLLAHIRSQRELSQGQNSHAGLALWRSARMRQSQFWYVYGGKVASCLWPKPEWNEQ